MQSQITANTGIRASVIGYDNNSLTYLRNLLERELRIGTVAKIWNDADTFTGKIDSDIAVFHIRLLEQRQIDMLKLIRSKSTAPVFIISDTGSFAEKILALQYGAYDYFQKGVEQTEFIVKVQQSITQLQQMNVIGRESRTYYGDLEIDPLAYTVFKGTTEISLTATEFALFWLLLRNRGRVFTKEQLYSSVWKEDYICDDHNVVAHIWRLRKKIEPNPQAPSYIKTVRGVGYKLNLND